MKINGGNLLGLILLAIPVGVIAGFSDVDTFYAAIGGGIIGFVYGLFLPIIEAK